MSFKMRGPSFFKESIKGYRKDSPDKNEEKLIIPSGDISMEGVDFPVHGIDNKGNEKIMKPGKNYKFPGDKVLETPMKHDLPGGEPHVHGDDEDRNFDVDTPESEFTKFDKRTYVDTDNEVKSKDTVKKKKKKPRRKGRLKRWLKKNIKIRGGTRPLSSHYK